MATLDLFEPRSEEVVRESLQRSKAAAHSIMRENFELAVAYMEGRQLDDVKSQLLQRYASTQTGKAGDDIAPQVVPLTQRYVAEAANAYNRPVERWLSLPDGEENDRTRKLTDELKAMLDAASYDELMHKNEQFTVLLRTSCVWYQGRCGKLKPSIVFPHDVYPVVPQEDLTWFDPADPDDYAGFAVQLFSDCEDINAASAKRFAWLEPSQTMFYRGAGPFEPDYSSFESFPNVYAWPQCIDTDDMRGSKKLLPLQMLTFWHREMATGQLIVDADAEIAKTNRELNLQFSILLDTLAHQGWSLLTISQTDPDAPPPLVNLGSRNALPLGPGESANLLSGTMSFSDLVSVLQDWIRLVAIAHRQSPNDFSLQAQQAASGFAKLVDSLPKIEARQERIKRLTAIERNQAWPRIAAIGSRLGLLSASPEELAGLQLNVRFADLEFPLNIDERTRKEEHEIKHGLTTPARILAKRQGMTLEQARMEVNANLGIEEDEDAERRAPLNGAQLGAVVEILKSIALGEVTRESAISLIDIGFNLGRELAEQIVADAERVVAQAEAAPMPPQPEPQAPPQQPAQAQEQPAPPQEDLLSRIIRRPRRG